VPLLPATLFTVILIASISGCHAEEHATDLFRLTDLPSVVHIRPGSQASFNVTVENLGGNYSDVAIDIRALPTGVSVVDCGGWRVLDVGGKTTYRLIIAASKDVRTGTYHFEVADRSADDISTFETIELHVLGENETVPAEMGRDGESGAEPLEPGAIRVVSDPPGVEVYLNDVYYGVTDSDWLYVRNLSPGCYTVTLEKYGYEEYTEPINVSEGATESISASLFPLLMIPADRSTQKIPTKLVLIPFSFVVEAIIAVTGIFAVTSLKERLSALATARTAQTTSTTSTTPTTTIMSTAQSVFPQELGNQYHDPEFIGMGGFARAFRAKRTTDGRIVAVKIPISLDKNRKAFLREITPWKWLKHENIASLHAANVLPIPHLEIEYAGHGSLDQVEVPVKLKTALAIVLGIADGLAYAHAQGVTHRDLKPAKILVTEDNTPKISDWGLSRIMAESETSRVHGFTPLYGAPEQVAPGEFGEPDERTDIYQLGLIFYWLLTGRTPYGGGDLVEVTTAIAKELPEPPSKINQEASVVDSTILKCLAKRKEDRYQSVRELREELTSVSSVSSMPSVSSASHIPSPEIYWF